MIAIERVEHISMAVREPGPVIEFFRSLLGFELRASSEHTDELDYRADVLTIPGTSNVDWEVLSPLGRASYLEPFLNGVRGPGLHHIGFIVADLDAAIGQMRALGIDPWGLPPAGSADPPHEAFIHPQRGGNGVLLQFYEDPASTAAHPPDGTTAGEDPASAATRPAGGMTFGETSRAAQPHPFAAAANADELPAGERLPTLGVRAVNHISHAHPDRRQLTVWYEAVLGMRSIYASPEMRDDPYLIETLETPGAQLRWEIIQPHGPRSFIGSYLEQRGPSFHHVTFEVGDWERAVAACAAHGVEPFGQAAGEVDGALWREAFIHPRHTGGVLIQFFWEERLGIWI